MVCELVQHSRMHTGMPAGMLPTPSYSNACCQYTRTHMPFRLLAPARQLLIHIYPPIRTHVAHLQQQLAQARAHLPPWYTELTHIHALPVANTRAPTCSSSLPRHMRICQPPLKEATSRSLSSGLVG